MSSAILKVQRPATFAASNKGTRPAVMVKKASASRSGPPPDKPRAASKGRRQHSDAVVDRWLDRRLRHLMDDLAEEPLPKSLVDMIEADRKRR